jgi:hypothetical protein
MSLTVSLIELMEETVSDRLVAWEARIIRWGIFLVFLATFGDYVFRKVWPVVAPLFAHVP